MKKIFLVVVLVVVLMVVLTGCANLSKQEAKEVKVQEPIKEEPTAECERNTVTQDGLIAESYTCKTDTETAAHIRIKPDIAGYEVGSVWWKNQIDTIKSQYCNEYFMRNKDEEGRSLTYLSLEIYSLELLIVDGCEMGTKPSWSKSLS